MSHFTTIKTEIRDRAILLEALQGLKVRFQENGTLQGHQNQKADGGPGDSGGQRLYLGFP